MSACVESCVRPTPAAAHCSVCHRTFGGVTGFDHHRRNGTCADPAVLGLLLRNGIWRYPGGERLAAFHTTVR